MISFLRVLLFCLLLPGLAWAEAPLRVVSLAPNLTETVFALGAGSRVVGVSDFCVYPPEALKLPRLGGKLNANLEALAKLAPDLVLIQGRQESIERWCAERDIALLRVNMDSLAGIDAGVRDIAAALDLPEAGEALRASIHADMNRIVAAVASRERPRVFLSLAPAGDGVSLFTCGAASFVAELLDIAGGENVFADLKQPYSQISLESLIARRPERILELRPDAPEARPWPRWADLPLPALEPDGVRVLTDSFLLIPGPRVAQTARAFASALHPEVFDALPRP